MEQQTNPGLVLDADGIGHLLFDEPGRPVNVLTERVMTALAELLATVANASADGRLLALVVRSGKPGSFIVGADVGAIEELTDPAQGVEGSRRGQACFAKLAALPVPTIAAIHGLCLGGGTEIALACDYRVASDDDRTRIGLPEVQLGILPAWGGTTRLPRLVGLQAGLDLMLTGKPARPSKAKRIGLVHEVFPKEQFLERTTSLAKSLAAGAAAPKVSRRSLVTRILDGTAPGRSVIVRAARKRVMGQTAGHYPAPLRILDVAKRGLSTTVAGSLDVEAEALGDLIVSPECKNLIHLFHLREDARKAPWTRNGSALPVGRMGVIGAGVMGGGIAQLAAYNDVQVRMKDIRHEAVGSGLAHARGMFETAVRRRRLSPLEMQRKMDLISGTLDYTGFGRADLVLEAVVERMDVKRTVLRDVEAALPAGAVIVSNTSSLSIDEMASGMEAPQRFAGMHFFNPVHRMPLVEVVRGAATSDDTVETVAAFAARLGKVPVISGDGPGFIVNRILGPYLNEAGHLLDEGVDAEAVDRIWTGFGMPMGPYRLIDEVGVDVARHAGGTLQAAFGPRLAPAKALVALGDSGRLGRKGGLGFYRYERGKESGFDPSVYDAMGLRRGRDIPKEHRVRDRLLLAMINEAARVLDDGIAGSAGEVDLAMVMGTGFPPFRGGLLKYADHRGAGPLLDAMEGLHQKLGGRFEPSSALVGLADGGSGFYRAFPGKS